MKRWSYLLSFLETNPMCSGSNFQFWWTQRSKCVFWLVELRILVDFAPLLSLRHLQWDLPTALKFPSLGQETQLASSALQIEPPSSYIQLYTTQIAILMVNMMENDGKCWLTLEFWPMFKANSNARSQIRSSNTVKWCVSCSNAMHVVSAYESLWNQKNILGTNIFHHLPDFQFSHWRIKAQLALWSQLEPHHVPYLGQWSTWNTSHKPLGKCWRHPHLKYCTSWQPQVGGQCQQHPGAAVFWIWWNVIKEGAVPMKDITDTLAFSIPE